MEENQNGNRKQKRQLGVGQAKADAFMTTMCECGSECA